MRKALQPPSQSGNLSTRASEGAGWHLGPFGTGVATILASLRRAFEWLLTTSGTASTLREKRILYASRTPSEVLVLIFKSRVKDIS